MEFKGTKGTWDYMKSHGKGDSTSPIKSISVTAWGEKDANGCTEGVEVCKQKVYDQSDIPEMEANMKLIAAAPELLEALQGLMSIPAKEGSFEEKTEWMRKAMENAELAIKKSLGGE